MAIMTLRLAFSYLVLFTRDPTTELEERSCLLACNVDETSRQVKRTHMKEQSNIGGTSGSASRYRVLSTKTCAKTFRHMAMHFPYADPIHIFT